MPFPLRPGDGHTSDLFPCKPPLLGRRFASAQETVLSPRLATMESIVPTGPAGNDSSCQSRIRDDGRPVVSAAGMIRSGRTRL
ncbi:hypothetical protein M493_14925 [Geobacillus genomosp. 3]|uniref:Uncharacterized protein n=1 Tax=Geobacillus genomosp. 3 TaxID=1921421 RepID=S5Z8T3_GEOG3|nr:hypothetical protein M493_14925 [Geobacillus genomosp. 3]